MSDVAKFAEWLAKDFEDFNFDPPLMDIDDDRYDFYFVDENKLGDSIAMYIRAATDWYITHEKSLRKNTRGKDDD